jgi:hypothetical protein
VYFIGDIPNDRCKISLYKWNSKYFVKFETPDLEQIFKISEMEIAGEENIRTMIDDAFVERVIKRFEDMYKDLNELID